MHKFLINIHKLSIKIQSINKKSNLMLLCDTVCLSFEIQKEWNVSGG